MMETIVKCVTSLHGLSTARSKTIICLESYKMLLVKLVHSYPIRASLTLYSLQLKVPFGDAVISTIDTCVGVELCEELFTPARFVIHCISS